ncbi:MAG TPA: hypothetical protein VGK78_09590 [Nocardioides sp.]|uniref:hypothetical protein n=1 Tax=Nocardioides sp. TaxID=35761 RepID=UPI002F40A451
MYRVASETSTVAPARRSGEGIGRRRIAKAPGPVAHALTAERRTLCGADVAGLLDWPDVDFGEVKPSARCRVCETRAAS